MNYYSYSQKLKEKYGEKVYKIPVDIGASCPNRDGKISRGGCIFCSPKGTGFESLCPEISPEKQLEKNILYIGQKYKVNKFIAYLQNYTNTYMEPEKLKNILIKLCREDVVEIAVSTRPDCTGKEILDVIDYVSKKCNKNITIELGLQSIKNSTLEKINRGHSVEDFYESVKNIKKYGFEVCVHIILNLPWDTDEDLIFCARELSRIKIDNVKIHSLYIVKNTVLGDMYQNGEISLISKDEYIKRLGLFIQNLSSEIAVERFFARAPKEDTLFCNFGYSWRKLKNEFDNYIKINNIYQGKDL